MLVRCSALQITNGKHIVALSVAQNHVIGVFTKTDELGGPMLQNLGTRLEQISADTVLTVH